MARADSYEVVWLVQAIDDLEGIVGHIALDSPANARRILTKLKEKAESLIISPLRGRVVPELASFGFNVWRELIVKPYRIVFRIDNNRVLVMAVLDSRRDLSSVLLEKLTRMHADG